MRVYGETLGLFALVTLIIAVLYRVPAAFLQRNLAVIAAALFLYLPALVLWRRGQELADYGLRLEPLWRSLRDFAVAVVLVFPLFSMGYALFVTRLCGELPRWLVQCAPRAAALRLPPDVLMLAFSQLVVVALPEEFFFRGYLQGRLSQVLPMRWALPLTALIFALGHYLVTLAPGSLAVFFPGLLFGVLRLRTGSVLAGTLLHACCNLLIDTLNRSFG